jgi:excisionase family DNA binding protein
MNKWLSVQEIARYIGVSKETIYRFIYADKIPKHRVGKLWKFSTEEIDAWIKKGGACD